MLRVWGFEFRVKVLGAAAFRDERSVVSFERLGLRFKGWVRGLGFGG